MGEVGERAEEFHAEIGAYAAERGIEAIIATGPSMQAAVCAYNEYKQGGAVWVEKREKFIERVLKDAPQYQTMLVKGSNYMKLDQVVRAVKEQYGN
jgi:UDP-N-acetylmuramoyl-tripeptide--D-alanyl-D-alanine ligase